jgi:hypothetical protein
MRCEYAADWTSIRRFDQGDQQVRLAGEVRVDGALGIAGRGRDLVERGGLEAALGEDAGRGVEEPLPCLGLSLLAVESFVHGRTKIPLGIGILKGIDILHSICILAGIATERR